MDNTARIWDAATGEEIAVLSGHVNMVDSAAFSPDGTRIVTAPQDETARIWDAVTGNPIAVLRRNEGSVPFFGAFQPPVTSAAFSPDGSRIVTASDDRLVRVPR
jgi:WD40 repeat protein